MSDSRHFLKEVQTHHTSVGQDRGWRLSAGRFRTGTDPAGAVAESVAELAGLLEQALQGGQTWLVCASSEHLQEMALGEQMRRAYREPRR